MRISVFSHYFLPEIGAPSARIGDFASQWIDAGHEAHIATCFPNHPAGVVYPGYQLGRYQHEVLNRMHVHRCWTYVTPNTGFVKRTLGHLSLWPSSRLSIVPKMPKPDCVIGTSPTLFAAMAARACARKHRVPFIMEVRDLWPAIFVELGIIRNPQVIRLLELWEMNLYRSAARVVTVTESFRENIVARGIPSDRVVTITNGAETDYWRPDPAGAARLRRDLGLEDKFVALYIGAHGISQALHTILKAAERLKNRSEIQFLFVGDGAEKAELVSEAARRRLPNVRFQDPVKKGDVRAYYSMADVSLVPLRAIPLFDTFIPSKMFEIMATGRPILASVAGEAARILERSGGADVVKPEDDGAIAERLGGYVSSPDRLRAMGEAGAEYVAANYSRRHLAQKYIEVMKEVVGSRTLEKTFR